MLLAGTDLAPSASVNVSQQGQSRSEELKAGARKLPAASAAEDSSAVVVDKSATVEDKGGGETKEEGHAAAQAFPPSLASALHLIAFPFRMRPRTIAMFVTLLIAIVMSALFFHHQHSEHLVSATHGRMSKETKEAFLKEGIDCMEVYEVQGYEGPESIFRMFQLSQHEYHNLNPGKGIFFNQGDVLCVKGIFGLSETHPFVWFWPIVVAGLAIAGFLSSVVISKVKSASEERKAGARKLPAASAAEDSSAVVVDKSATVEDKGGGETKEEGHAAAQVGRPAQAGIIRQASADSPVKAGLRRPASTGWPHKAGPRWQASTGWPHKAGLSRQASKGWPQKAGQYRLASQGWPQHARQYRLASQGWPQHARQYRLAS
eukprot:gene21282-28204_t